MLSKCLNPACSEPFRYLSEGRVFSLEIPPLGGTRGSVPAQRVERYWLCGNCAKHLKVVIENGEVTTRPLRREFIGERKVAAARAGHGHAIH